MSEPENKSPSKDNSERESVFRVLDELVSHMHTSRNVSMLLIVSAFILTPISLVIAVMLLTVPPFVPGGDVSFGITTTNATMINGTPSEIVIEGPNGSIMASTIHHQFIEHGMANMSKGNIVVMPAGSPPPFAYLPAGPPKFMISGGPYMHEVLDITTMIIVFAVISIVLSSVFLFIGIKEFTFFSKWNKKFARFMSLRDKIDKELGES